MDGVNVYNEHGMFLTKQTNSLVGIIFVISSWIRFFIPDLHWICLAVIRIIIFTACPIRMLFLGQAL